MPMAPHFHTCEEVRKAIKEISLNEESNFGGKPKVEGKGSVKVQNFGTEHHVEQKHKGADSMEHGRS